MCSHNFKRINQHTYLIFSLKLESSAKVYTSLTTLLTSLTLFMNPPTSSPRKFWKYIRNLKQRPLITDAPLSCFFLRLFFFCFKIPIHGISLSWFMLQTSLWFPHEMTIIYFSPDDIFTALTLLCNINSLGPDGISTRLLFKFCSTIFSPIYILYKYSMDKAVFPSI